MGSADTLYAIATSYKQNLLARLALQGRRWQAIELDLAVQVTKHFRRMPRMRKGQQR